MSGQADTATEKKYLKRHALKALWYAMTKQKEVRFSEPAYKTFSNYLDKLLSANIPFNPKLINRTARSEHRYSLVDINIIAFAVMLADAGWGLGTIIGYIDIHRSFLIDKYLEILEKKTDCFAVIYRSDISEFRGLEPRTTSFPKKIEFYSSLHCAVVGSEILLCDRPGRNVLFIELGSCARKISHSLRNSFLMPRNHSLGEQV